MKKIMSFLVLLQVIAVYGQKPVYVDSSGCKPTNIVTDPNNYDNPKDPTQSRKWDWMEENFTVFLTNQLGTPGTPVTIKSPFFFQNGNPNIFPFANSFIKDNHPEDGWELLYRKFGNSGEGVTTPYFFLYNRFTGTIRVFANIINSGDFTYTDAGLTLSFEPFANQPNIPYARQTAVLNQLGTYSFSNQDLQKNAQHFTPNIYINNGVNNNYFWVYADFPTLYDPCTCGLESNWYFSVGLTNNLIVKLTSNGTQTTIVDANPGPSTATGGFFGDIQRYLTFGSGVINGLNGVFTSANKGMKDGNKLLVEADTFALNLGPIIGKNAAKNFARSLGKLIFELPKVNMVVNLASTLISVVGKVGKDYDALTNDDPKSIEAVSNTTITESKISIQTTGTITIDGVYAKEILKTPGSQVPPGQGAIEHYNPIYDEILGVWNLFEQPKFKLTTIPKPNSIVGKIGDQYDCDCNHVPLFADVHNNETSLFPDIQRLELEGVPKVTLNPASGMKIIDIKYQIVYDNIDYTEANLISNAYDIKGNMKPGDFKYFESISESVFNSPSIVNVTYATSQSPWWDLTGTVLITTYHPAQCSKFIRKNFYNTDQTNRETFLESLGIQLDQLDKTEKWNKAILSTPYMAQNCLDFPEIFSYSQISNPRLRVKVILEPIINNPTSEVDEVVMIHTFPGIITNVTHNEPYIINGTPSKNMNEVGINGFVPVSIEMPSGIDYNFDGFSANSVLQNELLTENIKVRGDIHVLENVTFGSGNLVISASENIYIHQSLQQLSSASKVNFQAGKQVIVLPNAVVSPEIVLEINPNLIDPCAEIPEQYPSNPEIAAFCNGSVYDARSKPTAKGLENSLSNEVVSYLPIFKDSTVELDILLYPNPAKKATTVKLSREATGANVQVYDLMGRESNVTIRQNGLSFDLDLTDLTTGVYLVKVSSIEGTITKTLIVK